MNYIESQEILHQVYLERYKNGQAKEVLKLLEDANKRAQSLLRKSKDVTTMKHYKEVSEKLKAIAKDLKSKINKNLDTTELIEEEIDYLNKTYTKMYNKTGGTKYNFTSPNEKQIRSATMFKPFADGANYDTFLNSVQDGFYNVWDNSVRTGYLIGETTQSIIERVMGTIAKGAKPAKYGSIETIRNSIERNTRTWLQSMANQTRNSFYEENEDIISGYKWLSTLDRRSCLVCGLMDGKVQKNINDFTPPPVHFNCRCIILPVIKGYDDLNTEGRANSKESITYKQWFDEQSDEVKRDILGETRYKMHKEGRMNIKGFVSDNKVLTLNELKKK